MYAKFLRAMRKAVKEDRVIFVNHGFDELDDQYFSQADAYNAILTGEIVEDQFDEDVGDTKFKLYGEATDGRELCLIIKFDRYGNAVIITAWWVKYSEYE